MKRRFDYVKYDEEAMKKQKEFKAAFEDLEAKAEKLKDGRAKSLVMTKLEEAYMWVGKSLRDECIERNSAIPHVPERTNE